MRYLIVSLIYFLSAAASAQPIAQHFPAHAFSELPSGQSSCTRADSLIGLAYDCGVNQGIQFSGVSFPWPVSGAGTFYLYASNQSTTGGACVNVEVIAFPPGSNIYNHTSAVTRAAFKLSYAPESTTSTRIMRIASLSSFLTSTSLAGNPFTIKLTRVPCTTAGCSCGTSNDSSNFRIYMAKIQYQ